MSTKQYKQAGEDVWKNRTEKINAELFTLTYGALVIQLIKDYEDYAEVNKQLDKMGYNIGTRLIEDFLARTNLSKCSDFREVGEVVSKVGFKMFLNITPNVIHHQQEDSSSSATAASAAITGQQSAAQFAQAPVREFSLILDENPLAEFVELPRDARAGGLWFSNVLTGVLRGALTVIALRPHRLVQLLYNILQMHRQLKPPTPASSKGQMVPVAKKALRVEAHSASRTWSCIGTASGF